MKENKTVKIFECENGDLIQIGTKDNKIILIRQSFISDYGKIKKGIYYSERNCIYMIFEYEYIKKFLELGNMLINDKEDEDAFSGEDDYLDRDHIFGHFIIYKSELSSFNKLPITVKFFDSLEWALGDEICFNLEEFKIVLNCLENIIKSGE